MRFIYRLEGKAKVVSIPPIIKTDLPDKVEISATPLVSDYPPLSDYKPNSQHESEKPGKTGDRKL